MRVYSPSQTVSWLRCPILRMLQQEGWRSKYIAKRDTAAVLGTAFGAGVEAYYAKLETPPQEVARVTARDELDRLLGMGCQWYEGDEVQAASIPVLAAKAVEKFVKQDPLPAGWTVVDIQTPLPEHGNSRPDMTVRNQVGQLGIVDFKFKRTLKSEYRQQTIDEYLASWQFKHYAWAKGEVLGEPVAYWVLCMTVLEPRFEVIWRVAQRDGELLERWLTMARGAWAMMERMDRGEIAPWEAAEHRNQYGPCEFWRACYEHRLEEGLMGAEYVKGVR